MRKCDFSGWATKNDLKCGDGRTIRKDAFKHNDGDKVPLMWNHGHDSPFNVLGHALLENRNEGVYAYCYFNQTDAGKTSREIVKHGDIFSLSIYANKLKQVNGDVTHGSIREVSLVPAGANPGALIDPIIRHGAESDEEAIIYTGEEFAISHSDDDTDDVDEDEVIEDIEETVDDDQTTEEEDDEDMVDNLEHGAAATAKADDRTIQDVIDSMTEEQQMAMFYLMQQVMEDGDGDTGGDGEMKQNVFDQDKQDDVNVLQHSEMVAILRDAPKHGSLRESALQHGIDQIDYLFPDAQNLETPPGFIQREVGWVGDFMGSVRKTPFSRIKTIFADITEDEARARGYIKGKMKKEEVFKLLKRVTIPTTIYKKAKLDRDDVIDITDFDVVAWQKGEMRMMLDEEIARQALVGDGRAASSDDKIDDGCVRPVWTDNDLFSIKKVIEASATDSEDVQARAFIKAAVKARKDYKGSGNPVLYAPEDTITACLLIEDKNQRVIYDTMDKLTAALRVRKIVSVPVMENLSREDKGKTLELMGIIVDPKDYNIGADKGGAVNFFDDFDIDYNAQKYLIETRCSGALVKPYSAIVIEKDVTAAPAG